MNSVGVGISVALGAAIGLALVSRSAAGVEYVATACVYGFFAGVIYELAAMFVKARQTRYRR